MKKIVFPVLIFTKADKKMMGYDHKHLYGDLRFLNPKKYSVSPAFKNVELIDCNGVIHFVDYVVKEGRINIFKSIQLVGLMVKLKPIFEKEPKSISLNDLKMRIMAHVSKHSNYWSSLGTQEDINKMVSEANTYKQLILLFK